MKHIHTIGRIAGNRWSQLGQVYQGECTRQDCREANRCKADRPKSCADYPGAPSYPVAHLRHTRSLVK